MSDIFSFARAHRTRPLKGGICQVVRRVCSVEGVEDSSVLPFYVDRDGMEGTRRFLGNRPKVRQIWERACSPKAGLTCNSLAV